jgi:hypothetical protein
VEKHDQIVECPLVEQVIVCDGFWEVGVSSSMARQEFSYMCLEGIEVLACRVEWRPGLRATSLMTGRTGS